MASKELAGMKLLQHDRESVGTALSAIEENMFKTNMHKQEQAAEDVTPDSLRYLFGIFN